MFDDPDKYRNTYRNMDRRFIIFIDPYLDNRSGTKLLTENIEKSIWKAVRPELVDNDLDDGEHYEGQDEFLGYAKTLQCYPDEQLSEEQLILFCRKVSKIYSEAGYKTVVAANFEDKV
ncbi:MAG: hypothetical protein OEZ34_04250 [Spirochaetia bacterium]|nr:hypothetical protein [Spirochaetia bacterium]